MRLREIFSGQHNERDHEVNESWLLTIPNNALSGERTLAAKLLTLTLTPIFHGYLFIDIGGCTGGCATATGKSKAAFRIWGWWT
jgi:hypothetical protein